MLGNHTYTFILYLRTITTYHYIPRMVMKTHSKIVRFCQCVSKYSNFQFVLKSLSFTNECMYMYECMSTGCISMPY